MVSAALLAATVSAALAEDMGLVAYNSGGYAPPAHREKIAAKDEKTTAFARQAAEEYLAGQMPEAIEEWRIAELFIPGNERIPADFESFQVVPQRLSKGGEFHSLSIEFSNNGKIISRLGVDLKVEMFAEFAVAKSRIASGTIITAEMLSLERRKVESPIEDLCTQIAQAVGQEAERNISPGRAVHLSALARAADIKAGDVVTIIAESDSIRLTARGVAKKDGTIGETIPVVNLRSNKKLFAKVLDGGTVQVIF